MIFLIKYLIEINSINCYFLFKQIIIDFTQFEVFYSSVFFEVSSWFRYL